MSEKNNTNNNNDVDLTFENQLADKIKNKFGDAIKEITVPKKNRIHILAETSIQKDLLRWLKEEEKFNALSSLTAVDWPPDHFDVVYHLNNWGDNIPTVVEVIFQIPRDDPHIETVFDLWKSADWHEREIYDLFGIRVDGHPNLTRLLLPEEWDQLPHKDPNALWPMRKDYKLRKKPFKRIREVSSPEDPWAKYLKGEAITEK